jgi:hypothetical protein
MAQKFDNHMIFRIVLIVLAAFILFALINYYNSKQQTNVRNTEKFYQDSTQQQLLQQQQQQNAYSSGSGGNGSQKLSPAQANEQTNNLIVKQKTDAVKPAEEQGNGDFRAVDFKSSNLPSDCFPRDRLSAEDLLPADAANSKWAQVNPAGQGDVSNQNFLTAGWAVGINTISGSLRNANLQLRSEPPNPRGSWPINNSTIESDLMRRPLELGGDCGL